MFGVTAADAHRAVKSAGRTLDVLEALAAGGGPRPLGELSRALGIPKSSLHALLRTLLARGWVETDDGGARFALGVRALEVGAAYLGLDGAVGLLGGVLDRLAARFAETAQLFRLDGGSVVLLARRESPHALRAYHPIGCRLPAHATAAGRALLAQRPDDAVDRLLSWPLPARTESTVTGPAWLRAELAAVRARGWAAEAQECDPGLAAVAVAVPLHRPATEAIALCAPVTRLGPQTRARMADALVEAAGRVSTGQPLLAGDTRPPFDGPNAHLPAT
ncbi:IclR family transcriptional regulator [Micromonospora sp. KC207]|uniref:IclR family transcriptional regulator n=1 Tax=Micromonospora sp. KC207 TaxID=2530377 RepID=UPI0010460E26|nr:IclR family transcriptional regulator [Micromonospora sp. KC207]TDC60571.1 IclR family transcriptional regulator [Micromonospora sp. KC207]